MLFVALLSNVLAGFLQALSIRLGTASGLNLAEACRAFLPRWLSWKLYGMALVAIVATQFTEVCNRISIYVAVSEADHDTKVVTVAIVVNIMNPSFSPRARPWSRATTSPTRPTFPRAPAETPPASPASLPAWTRTWPSGRPTSGTCSKAAKCWTAV